MRHIRPALRPLLIGILVVGLLATTAFFAWQWYQLRQQISGRPGDAADRAQVEAMVREVGTLIALPTDETPTMASVSDVSKLSSQPFFSRAQNGDVVLLYTQAKKAYLYRPKEKILIDVAPLLVGEQGVSPQSTPKTATSTASSSLRVALYNGSTTSGLTTAAAKRLQTVLPDAVIVRKENAAKNDYTDTLLINLTGVEKATIDTLAKTFAAAVDQLPAGEAKPDADLLLILAK